MDDNKKANTERVDRFFKEEPIKYESIVGKAQVSLTLQHQRPSPWKRGIDHLCYADVTVEFLIGYSGGANRNPSLNWKPGYLHVDSGDPTNFGGLFEEMHNHAENFAEPLSHGNSSILSVRELRRAFDRLEDQLKVDFDNEEFKKHFVDPNADYSDD